MRSIGSQKLTDHGALPLTPFADLRNQLEKAEAHLQIATTEKTKLLDLLAAEKAEKREMKAEMLALMPPPEQRDQKTEQIQIKPRSWLQRLIRA